MVSQMARAKYLGEPFMAHLENLYNIPCNYNIFLRESSGNCTPKHTKSHK